MQLWELLDFQSTRFELKVINRIGKDGIKECILRIYTYIDKNDDDGSDNDDDMDVVP